MSRQEKLYDKYIGSKFGKLKILDFIPGRYNGDKKQQANNKTHAYQRKIELLEERIKYLESKIK